MNNSTTTQIVEKLTSLPDDLQQKVLEYVQTLVSLSHGVPGRQLLRFAGIIPFDDLQRMRDAIETGCEPVDVNEW